ncbi:MAG: hypothetical protein HQM09_09675 [Candidatus Riflebacteria bacterium]|nr:hypothetical protein [Candidatus Riflebacteria bacterium]
MVRSQIFRKAGLDSTLAEGSTQLQSIVQFYDANGVFSLESPKKISIQGNNNTTSLMIDGQMTLDKLAAGIQNAVNRAHGLDIENTKAMIVGTAISGLAGVGGYLQITSGMIGKDGQIAFLADQPVLAALGLATMREAKNNLYEVTLKGKDGSSQQVRTETNRATGLLDGVDVKFNSQAAQIAGTTGLEQGIRIATASSFDISAAGINFNVTVPAGDWTLEGLARSMTSQLLGSTISGANATVIDGELRINFVPTMASIASTIILGNTSIAAPLGFTNGTYSGFADGKKDTSFLINGFSMYATDADTGIVGHNTVIFTIDDGTTSGATLAFTAFITLNSAQINAADMVEFTSFQISVNHRLVTAGVYVRLDQVGNAMAFTALRVGRESLDNGVVNVSAVNLSITQGAATLSMAGKFGFDSATTLAAKGSGDKNFQMHVVDNTPQYQIGADQGQAMKVAFADMSAESLDVSNLDMTSIKGATEALGKLNIAIDKVSAERSKLGAFQNRLEYSINNLRSTNTNLTAAEARIRDTDMAAEMIEFTRNQVVSQAGNAMLAQANTIPQQVLQLLK